MLLKIKLLSDTCIGSGESIAGVIDTDINFDKYGIPFIPAKRVKGLLKEAATDLNELFSGIYSKNIKKLFGVPGGSETGCLLFDNGYINEYEKLIEEIDRSKNSKYKNIFSESILKEYFTDIRVNTAIDKETFIAKKGSLRNIRVIKSGIEFNVYINLTKDLTSEDKDLLEKAVKIVRHIGINRTRGLGQVEFYIEYTDKNSKEKSTSRKLTYKNNNKLRYTIELLQPAIINENYISGSMILGIFANRYIKFNNIVSAKAHENKEFRRIFLDGNVKFLNAYPYKNNKLFYSTPLSIVKKKFNGDEEYENDVVDLANFEGKDFVLSSVDQYKTLSSQFICIDEDIINVLDVESELYYHHKRPEDKSIGHATESEGEYFQYYSVAKGEVFCGEIWAEEDFLNELENLFDEEIIYVGKSRSSQYGKARIKLIKSEEEEINKFDDMTVITLKSPMIIRNDKGYYSTDINDIVLNIFGEKKDVYSAYVKNKIVGGYNSKWGFPKGQSQAFKEGTVIVINEELDYNDIKRINSSLYGERTEEGFGQVAINMHGEVETLRIERSSEDYDKTPLVDIDSNQGNNIYEYSLKRMIKNKLKFTVYDKESISNEIIKFLKSCNKSVSMNLLLMLLQSNTFESFEKRLEHASKRSTKGKKNNVNPYKKFMEIASRYGTIIDTFKKIVTNVCNIDLKDSDILKTPKSKEIIYEDNVLFDLYKAYLNNIFSIVKYEMRGE